MRFRLVKAAELAIDHELIWSSVAALCVLLGLVLGAAPPQLAAACGCPFRAITGLPCLSCGMTRSLAALLRGDVATSVAMNPLFAVFCLFAAAYAVYAAAAVALGLPRLRVSVTSRRVGLALRAGLPAVLAANWTYLICVGV